MKPLIWNRHGLTDRDAIAKAYLTEGNTSELNAGGRLNPEQQLSVYQAMRVQSTLLGPRMGVNPMAAHPSMLPPNASNPSLPNIDALAAIQGGGPLPAASGGPGISFINQTNGRMSGTVEGFLRSGHVLHPATQGTPQRGPSPSTIKPRTRTWELKKFSLKDEWSTEMTFETILEDRMSEYILGGTIPLAVNDLEHLALYGDEDIVPGNDPLETVLSINDGWLKQLRAESPKLSHAGDFINSDFWYAMLRKLPDLYRSRELFWFCNRRLQLDWTQYLGSRGAGAIEASLALGGRGIAPCGIQFWDVPLLRTDEPIVQASAATSARVKSYNFDQFRFPVDAYQIGVNIDGAGEVVISFPTTEASNKQDRTVSASRAINLINDALVAAHGRAYANVARHAEGGKIELLSPTAGGGSSIALTAQDANALPALGFEAGTTTGVAANGGGTSYNGTTCLLLHPAVLEMRVSTAPQGTNAAGFRQSVKYVQETDMYRYDGYGYMDFTTSAPEAVVVGENIRVSREGEVPLN